MSPNLSDFDSLWLPHRPLAGASKTGPYYRTSREKALSLPYFEANPSALQSLIITDHDNGRADYLAEDNLLPPPSFTVINPETRNGHIGYALASPVCLTDAARRGPVNYLARIEKGLQIALEGDCAYTGAITKNPFHQMHIPLWDAATTPDDCCLPVYSLNELAEALKNIKALPRLNNKKALTTTSVGRNCALFERVRKWSYPRRGEYTDQSIWEKIVFHYAWEVNETIIGAAFAKGPLSFTEVTHLARSVSRWTWRNLNKTFSQVQSERGKKGGQARVNKGGGHRKINLPKLVEENSS